MKRKIKSLNDLYQQKEMLKIRERVIYAEINGQVEKIGMNIMKSTLSSILNKFKKS